MMKTRTLALLAFCALSVLSAEAGTIIFHTGDPAHPPVGVDGWTTATMGTVVTLSAAHNEYAVMTPDVYVEEITGSFTHEHDGAKPGGHGHPEIGSLGGGGTVSGSVYWWFEYVPDNALDVPDAAHPYYADIQTRGKASMVQGVQSDDAAAGIEVQGGSNGLLTQLLGTTVCSGFGDQNIQYFYTTGSPWAFQETPSGFTFSWDATLGKWIGKPQFLNAASADFTSLITVSGQSDGRLEASIARQLKVLRVRTPSGGVFTFNSAWT